MKKELSAKEKKLIKKNRIKELMESYTGLLTERERKILTLYVDPNNNGALVARNLGVSRQAIHDHIRRAVGKMERCDSKAHTVEIRKKEKKLLLELEGIIDSVAQHSKDKNTLAKIEKAKNLLAEIAKLG
ncbi:MAG: sigma factor-like helix-turn-helix DNA-binding protein [Caldisericaceae bacterium]